MCDQAVIDLECQCLQREPYSNTASYIFILIFCKGSCSELCRTLKPVCTVKKGCHWAETDSEKAAFKLKIYFTAHSIHLMELQICLMCAVNPHKFSTSVNLWLVNFRRWSTTSHSESSYLWRDGKTESTKWKRFHSSFAVVRRAECQTFCHMTFSTNCPCGGDHSIINF